MSFQIYVTRDFDQMSQVAAGLVEADIRDKQAVKDEYVLGLATGNSPTGLYKHLAKAFNAGRIDAGRVRSFNLDEYVGLPGENAQQRALHCESYSFFMIMELFGLLQCKFRETNVPWGTLIDEDALTEALDSHPEQYELQGMDKGRAIVIKDSATGVLKDIKVNVLEAYENKIQACGGIDLHVIGVGGRGHVAFHECGIPFEGNRVLLVELDRNTRENAVVDKHFSCVENSARYAVSMGAELLYQARSVLMVANGRRKMEPVTESVVGEVSCDIPLSYSQHLHEAGGRVIYVLDEAAGAGLLDRRAEVEAKGYDLIDVRAEPYIRVSSLTFSRDPITGCMG